MSPKDLALVKSLARSMDETWELASRLAAIRLEMEHLADQLAANLAMLRQNQQKLRAASAAKSITPL